MNSKRVFRNSFIVSVYYVIAAILDYLRNETGEGIYMLGWAFILPAIGLVLLIAYWFMVNLDVSFFVKAGELIVSFVIGFIIGGLLTSIIMMILNF